MTEVGVGAESILIVRSEGTAEPEELLAVARGENYPKFTEVDSGAPVRGENPPPKHPIADVTETVETVDSDAVD